MKMRYFLHRLMGTTILLSALWLTGLLWFIHLIPSRVQDTTTITDGIVALTGGSSRLSTAISLLNDNKAKKLLITGVGKGITLANLGSLDDISKIDIAHNGANITLGYIAKDTRQNALETAIWADLEHIKSIRVVTANYHIPRSMLEFTYAMPDVAMIPHPVFSKRVKVTVKDWWHFPGSTLLIMSEYHKYMGSYLHHTLQDILHSFANWLANRLKPLTTK